MATGLTGGGVGGGSGLISNSGKPGGVVGTTNTMKAVNWGDLVIDASIVSIIRENGYNLTAIQLDPLYVVNNFQWISKIIVGNKSIPAFQDSSGRQYVIDEQQRVYLIEKSAAVDVGANTTNAGGTTTLTTGINNVSPVPEPPGGFIGSGKIYTKFNTEDIIYNQQETVTHALWSNNVGNLTQFYTNSGQTDTQKEYYYEVYNSSSVSVCGSEAQFSVVYGNKLGSGSIDDGGQINDTPSRAIYGQYRLLCLDQGEEYFSIDGTNINHFYAINVNRARMKEYLDEGNIEINLHHLSGSEFVAGGGSPEDYTGSNVTLGAAGTVLRLIDDSTINAATIKESGEVYNIVSGSIEDGVYNSASPHIYGKMYRRKGIIILSADKLNESASFGTCTGSEKNGDNAYKLFMAISGAAQYTDVSGDPLGFQGRGAEKIKSTHFFVRAKNAEYNFSNNPTFVSGSEGDLRHPMMITNPRTYLTTIGLYNDKKDLIAVAKLSKPIEKSFTKEALVKIKLDFVWILGIISTIGMSLGSIL